MKHLFFAGLLGVMTCVSSCGKDDNSVDNNTSPAVIKTTITAGSWRVTNYFDTDHDETSSFNGFNFVFDTGGGVIASNTLFAVNGTWQAITDDSKAKLVLDFDSNAPSFFQEIEDDWRIISRTDTKITLEDPSSGGGGTDKLTFEKN